MINQQTLSKTISFRGIGLHSGSKVNVRVKPADENQGILFRRVDLCGHTEVPADLDHVKDVNFSITLGTNGLVIKTVEHLLASMAGLGIDNATVEVDGPEVPGMDGSAMPFVGMLREAGVIRQSKPRYFIKVTKPIEVVMDGRFTILLPYPEQKISYTIGFDHPLLNRQYISFAMNETYFAEQIASARTFGFLKDAEKMKKMGLAKGVSLDNSIVIGEKRVLNDKLRYKDEFVRHKALDFIGDISLVGKPIIGHLIALKSGHQMNTQLCKKVLEESGSWVLVDGNGAEDLYRDEISEASPALTAKVV